MIDLSMIDFEQPTHKVVDSIAKQACKQVDKLSYEKLWHLWDSEFVGSNSYTASYHVTWDNTPAVMDAELTWFDDSYRIIINVKEVGLPAWIAPVLFVREINIPSEVTT